MRRLIVTILSLGLTGTVFGHTLDSEHSLVASLWHQLMGIHHLPYTLALLIGAVVLFAIIGRRMARHRT